MLHIDEVDASLTKRWFYVMLYSKDGDIISKMQIALKEANETGYWLELLYKINYIGEEQYNFLESKCKSLRAMLVSSINTAKNNNK